jgi:hypothetical protein
MYYGFGYKDCFDADVTEGNSRFQGADLECPCIAPNPGYKAWEINAVANSSKWWVRCAGGVFRMFGDIC